MFMKLALGHLGRSALNGHSLSRDNVQGSVRL
jgi:hypothetical protein